MNTYKINFEYTIPQFTEIEIDAENPEAAEATATEVFNEAYPEAIDAKAVMVTKI